MALTTEVICPTCKASVAMRVNRTGFLQRKLLGHFGIYPWKCGACGALFLFRHRGHRTRSSRPQPDASGHGEGSTP